MERAKRAAHSVDPAVIEANAKGSPERCIFAKTLNYLLEAHGIDQEKMADDLDLSEGAIHNYRTGKTDPKLTAVVKIAEYLHVDCDYLMRGVESKHTAVAELGLTNESIEKMLWLSTGTWKKRIVALNALLNTRELITVLDQLDAIGKACDSVSVLESGYHDVMKKVSIIENPYEAFSVLDKLSDELYSLRKKIRYDVFDLSEAIKEAANKICRYNNATETITKMSDAIFNEMSKFDEDVQKEFWA